MSIKPFPTEVKIYFLGYNKFISFFLFFFLIESQKEKMINKFKKHK